MHILYVTDIDECKNPADNNCGNKKCENTVGGYKCLCQGDSCKGTHLNLLHL